MGQHIIETQNPASYDQPPMGKRTFSTPGYHDMGEVKAEVLTRWHRLLDEAAALATDDPDSLLRVETQRHWRGVYMESRKAQ